MYYRDGKSEFSAVITLVFSVTWSFRNHSNMISINDMMLKIAMLLNTFVETVKYILSGLFDE